MWGPGNVRWVSRSELVTGPKRNDVWVQFYGKSVRLVDFAKEHGICIADLHRYVRRRHRDITGEQILQRWKLHEACQRMRGK